LITTQFQTEEFRKTDGMLTPGAPAGRLLTRLASLIDSVAWPYASRHHAKVFSFSISAEIQR
jgi:hypothetical protein